MCFSTLLGTFWVGMAAAAAPGLVSPSPRSAQVYTPLAWAGGGGGLVGVALLHRLAGVGELRGHLLDLLEVLGLVVELGHLLVELLLGEAAVLLGLLELLLALVEVGELLELLAHLLDLL